MYYCNMFIHHIPPTTTRFFYEQFILSEEAAEEVTIPSLPDDPKLKGAVDLSKLMPMFLRYVYENQSANQFRLVMFDASGALIDAVQFGATQCSGGGTGRVLGMNRLTLESPLRQSAERMQRDPGESPRRRKARR